MMRRFSETIRLGLSGLLLLAAACEGTVTFESKDDEGEASSSGAEPDTGMIPIDPGDPGGSGDPGDEAGDPTESGETGGSSTGGDEPVCGDDIAEGDEICDGDDLDGKTCALLGLEEGELGCNEDCTAFDASGCGLGSATCGNGMIEAGEACDGEALADQTCVSLGFDEGELGCSDDCTALDDSECVGWVGDCCAANDSPGCDHAACTEAVCEIDSYCCSGAWDSLCANKAEANMAEGGACAGSGGSCGGPCGDGAVDPGETCDGAALGGATCESQGFEGGGALACDAGCGAFDTSACVDWAGSCCAANSSPGCGDTSCAEAVCMVDPFCCSGDWDELCASLADADPACEAAPGC